MCSVEPPPEPTSASVGEVARDGDAVDALRLRAREAAVAAAGLLSAVVMVADMALPGFEADEVAFALAWTPVAARRQVDFGRYLTRTLPAVFGALSTGDIDAGRAWVFCDQLATVDDAVAARIAGSILPQAPDLTTSQLRDRLRRAVLKADPGAAAARVRHSEAERYVATTPDNDGTASLYGVRLPAGRTVAAFERVDAYARARKGDGDARTLDQLRADTFLDLLEGIAVETPPVHRSGVIELTVPWETAVALGDQPATLAGYGPIAAAVARDLIDTYGRPGRAGSAGATAGPRWRYSIHAPDGSLLVHRASPAAGARTATPPVTLPRASGPDHCIPRFVPQPVPPAEADPTRRTPGVALTRWIAARDRTCRAPGCQTLARASDIDHTTDHAAGGPTAHHNLALLCRHHHRTKHEGGWTVTQPAPGLLRWVSPSGREYDRRPDPPW